MTRLNPTEITRVRELAQDAAVCAMSFYKGDFNVTMKSDNSPVTQADLAVSELLEKQLPEISDFPVLSEENKPDEPLWTTWETYWLVDPIDGTRHFINRTGEFCICIALIHQHKAIFGLIIAPTTGELWLAQQGNDEHTVLLEKYNHGELVELSLDSQDEKALMVTLSGQEITKRMEVLLSVLPTYQYYGRGSALKYIDVVEGKAMLYPKIWDTCEWDSAAGQCILECAGGEVLRFDTGEPLRYGEQISLVNPHFFAYKGFSDEVVSTLRAIYPSIPNPNFLS